MGAILCELSLGCDYPYLCYMYGNSRMCFKYPMFQELKDYSSILCCPWPIMSALLDKEDLLSPNTEFRLNSRNMKIIIYSYSLSGLV